MSVPPDKLHQRQVYDSFLVWKGTWSAVAQYRIGDVVVRSGACYICILQNTNQQPPNATYWQAT